MFDIRSLTWDEWSYPEGVILPARNATSFIIKLYSETQVSGRLGMSGGISPRHAQNPLSGERRKTLSITHHALSPPPSHHHLYIIHLINWLQRFYRIIMSLKRPFVPKSDVKQWFTTTTQTSHNETPTGCWFPCVCTRATEYFQNGRQILPQIVNFTSQSTLLWTENTQLKIKNWMLYMLIWMFYTYIP